MPDAKSPTDAPPPTATVCTCGYDLTGLPPQTDARCPECGVVIASLPTGPPSCPRLGSVIFAMLVPAMIAGPAMVLGAVSRPKAPAQTLAGWLWTLSIATLVLIAIPASIMYGFLRPAAQPVIVRLIVVAAAIGLCIAGNGLALAMIAVLLP